MTNSSEYAEAHQSRFVDAASRAGVKHIVKLSQWAAYADSPVRFLRYHAAVERKIEESGMAFTFLRPNLFMQGLLAFRETIVGQGQFFAAASYAKISAVDVRDIAAVAAAALTQDGHDGKTYDLTGPEALTHGEMAEKLSKAVGREIQYVDVPEEAMMGALLNTSADVGEVDVYAREGNKKLFGGVNALSETSYTEIDPMSGTLEVRSEGKNNAVLTIPNAKFNAGDTYTIVVTGKAKGAPKLEAMVIEDKLGGTTKNAGITRQEYERNKDSYTEEAKRLGRTIGAGANDGWRSICHHRAFTHTSMT